MDPEESKRSGAWLVWGAGAGALWSLIPGILSEMMRPPGQAATVLVSGALTGLLVSGALAPFLVRARRWQAVGMGLLSLPLGAGLYGSILPWLHWAILKVSGVHFRCVMEIVEPPGHVFDPLGSALFLVGYSSFTWFALLCYPLAVLTTLRLRRRLLRAW